MIKEERLYWRSGDNMVNIKNLSNSALKSNLNYLYNTQKEEVNGYSKSFWILHHKKELNYRKQREDVIINAVPYVREKLNELVYNIKYKSV